MHDALACTSLLEQWQPVLEQQALLAAVLLIQVDPLLPAQHTIVYHIVARGSIAQHSTAQRSATQ